MFIPIDHHKIILFFFPNEDDNIVVEMEFLTHLGGLDADVVVETQLMASPVGFRQVCLQRMLK